MWKMNATVAKKTSRPSLVLTVVALVIIAMISPAQAHGYLKFPPARNVLANSNYCPHCLNGGTVAKVSASGTLLWPEGKHGICGDPYDGPRDHEYGGKYYVDGGIPKVTYMQGDVAKIEVFISTNHNGRFKFRICKFRANSPFETEKDLLTEECLDQYVLKQADVPGAQKPGEVYFYTTPGDPVTTEYIMYYQLPPELVCDGVYYRCVMQWYWVSGNTCNPPGTPDKYKRPFSLSECGDPKNMKNYPEEFWNCADIKIAPNTWRYLALPGNQGVGDVLAEVDKSNRLIDKTLVEKAAAESFCTTRVDSVGVYPDYQNECKGYFVCTEIGSWYYRCPVGLLYDEKTKVCQFSHTVTCVDGGTAKAAQFSPGTIMSQ